MPYKDKIINYDFFCKAREEALRLWPTEIVERSDVNEAIEAVIRITIEEIISAKMLSYKIEVIRDKNLCDSLASYMVDKQIHYKEGDIKNYDIDNLELVPIKDEQDHIHDILDATQEEDSEKKIEDQEEEIFADRESYASSLRMNLPGGNISPYDLDKD